MLKIVHFKQMRSGEAWPSVDDGDLDCREMRDILAAKGYDGPAIMEIPPHPEVFRTLKPASPISGNIRQTEDNAQEHTFRGKRH